MESGPLSLIPNSEEKLDAQAHRGLGQNRNAMKSIVRPIPYQFNSHVGEFQNGLSALLHAVPRSLVSCPDRKWGQWKTYLQESQTSRQSGVAGTMKVQACQSTFGSMYLSHAETSIVDAHARTMVAGSAPSATGGVQTSLLGWEYLFPSNIKRI